MTPGRIIATAPGYWMSETSGLLAPAVKAYLIAPETMTPPQIAYMRAYLRQWIEAPAWQGEGVEELRASVDGLTSPAAIARWLDAAAELAIDPL